MWLWVASAKDAPEDESRIELIRMVINNWRDTGYMSKEQQMNQFVEALGGLFDKSVDFSKVSDTAGITGAR
jgi:hypothetical protein